MTLVADVSHPGSSPVPMTGTFEWTYVPGDFENGSGAFLEASIPWYNDTAQTLDVMFDLGSIEFTHLGNIHNLGVDVTLRLASDLSPDQPSPIDLPGSNFTIEVGVNTSPHQGHLASGSIVPVHPYSSFCFGSACPCANPGIRGSGCENSTGAGALLGVQGSSSLQAGDLKLVASGIPAASPVMLVSGTEPAGGGLGSPLHDGLLCVGGAIYRLEVQFADTSGAAEFGPGLGSQGLWAIGQTVHFQLWYRDGTHGTCASGSNLTNGMSVTFAQ